MHGVQWEHTEGKGGKTKRQCYGGCGILPGRMRMIWRNGKGVDGGERPSGRDPCLHALRKGKIRKHESGKQDRDPFKKFCLGLWILNLN